MLLLEVLFSIVLILICNRRTRGVFFSPEEHNTKNLKVLAVAKQRKTTYLVPTYKRHVFTIDWLVDRVVSMADHAAGRPGFEPWPCRTEIAAEEKRNVLSFHGNSKKPRPSAEVFAPLSQARTEVVTHTSAACCSI